jgi:hypothetical protein
VCKNIDFSVFHSQLKQTAQVIGAVPVGSLFTGPVSQEPYRLAGIRATQSCGFGLETVVIRGWPVAPTGMQRFKTWKQDTRTNADIHP